MDDGDLSPVARSKALCGEADKIIQEMEEAYEFDQKMQLQAMHQDLLGLVDEE